MMKNQSIGIFFAHGLEIFLFFCLFFWLFDKVSNWLTIEYFLHIENLVEIFF